MWTAPEGLSWLGTIVPLDIGTERADDVDVSVEILSSEPPLLEADHSTEASIKLRGEVAVLGCTDYVPDAKRVKARGSRRRPSRPAGRPADCSGR